MRNIKIIFSIIAVSLFINSSIIASEGMPFSRGVNLTTWFQTSGAKSIQFSKYTKQDFINIQSLGCDVIRLPIEFHSMTLGAPEYEIDPLLYSFLDEVVNWAEELDINLILDNHSFDPAEDTNPNIANILIPVWQQLAEHFKNRSELIFYEILNEPHGINDATWNTIQQNVINVIRQIDSVHTIIVGPAGWNSYNNLKYMPEYSDTNLIYTFHFYDPFLFTHQGASWTDPSLVELEDVPFPYNSAEMPNFPSSLSGTWIASAFNSYGVDGTEQKVKQLLDIAADFRDERNVKIFCGEFGVYIPNSNNDDRIVWYELMRNYLEEKNISWTIWDYQGGFGLFEKGSNELFNSDLNMPLVKALGLIEVEQEEFIIKPDTVGFGLYGDFIQKGIQASSYSTSAQLNYYNNENPADGSYCISWENAAQYDFFGFNFFPNKDLSYLVSKSDISLRFYIKCDTPIAKFDIRFVDTKTEAPEDHPWRMRYTMDETIVPFDNEWHLVEIPLKNFTEHGSWDDDTWYNPIGEFDWKAVDILEIVAEHSILSGVKILFDEIEIYDPNVTSIVAQKIENTFNLAQNYPNPFNPSTKISFNLKERSIVNLKVYNILGEKITDLINQELDAGFHEISLNAENMASGTYIYTLTANNSFQSRRMVLLK